MRTFLVAFFLTLGIVCALAQANNQIGGIGTGMYVGNITDGAVYSYANGLGFNNVTPPVTPSFTVTGPSSGTINVASTNFTLALSGTTFNGARTVTISDGSKGGTITPSVGSPGTSSVTVTPAASATGFTFTYKPIIASSAITLTYTNAQAWTNQTPQTYTPAFSCTASTNLQGRMDNAQNQVAVDTLVCGMVTDGTYSLLDALYVFATNSTTNANLNWAQTSYPLTKVGSVTFTANSNYQGDGSTGYFTNGFIPSSAPSPQYVVNSGSIGTCVVNSRTTGQAYTPLGAQDASPHVVYFKPYGPSGLIHINDNQLATITTSNAQGGWITTRVAGTITLYLNGSSIGTATTGSNGVPTVAFLINAFNNNGTPIVFSADQYAYVLFGAGMNSTQAGNLNSRLHTYLQAVGETTAC